MSNPWDAPPSPKRGDFDDSLTYAGIGRVVSHWEMLEYRLAVLYSTFSGKPDNFRLIREYGEPNIFRLRFEALARRAEDYFQAHSNQNLEGDFHLLSKAIVGWSGRRNEVAHGIVAEIQIVEFFRAQLDFEVQLRSNFAVAPPYYPRRFHGADGMPLFAYTSVELNAFFAGIFNLVTAVQKFDLTLVPATQR